MNTLLRSIQSTATKQLKLRPLTSKFSTSLSSKFVVPSGVPQNVSHLNKFKLI
jgi:hypothetical protein